MSPHRFPAMGCEIVVGGASASERQRIERLFRERDRMFSRFRPDSELNRVNRATGRLVPVSAAFAAMLDLALRATAETRGLVDPTLGAELEAAGYDRDFAELACAASTFPMCTHVESRPFQTTFATGSHGEPGPFRTIFPMGTHGKAGRWRAVRVGRRAIDRPPGMLLDLNGVVKGRSVDDALELISGDGFVSAGGDIASRGPLEVALPGGGAVQVVDGGLATSSSAKRRWKRAGEWQHHLIDPGTGRPSESRWRDVTVGAATCLQADVAAKAAFLLGDDGPRFLEQRRLGGRFVACSGEVVHTARWPASERAVA